MSAYTSPTRGSISSSPSDPMTWSKHRQEEVINAYEAEEERIVNTLSKKLEKLRQEKINLENTLEAESESHVNRLSRELTNLRLAVAQSQGHSPTTSASVNGHGSNTHGGAMPEPTPEVILESLRRENESLRNRLMDMERDYVRTLRFNEIYREELIEHRNKLGLPVDSLVGLADPSSGVAAAHPTPRRTRSISRPMASPPASSALPIPRTDSHIRLPSHSSTTTTSAGSSFFSMGSPSNSRPAGTASHRGGPSTSTTTISTAATTPASTTSQNTGVTFAAPMRGLTYPSVPPPSLSSSFGGSPNISYFPPGYNSGSAGASPPVSRRSSTSLHSSRRGSIGGRRESLERAGPNGRVVETGSLVRSRSTSVSNTEMTPGVGDDPTQGGLDELAEELEFDPGDSGSVLPTSLPPSGNVNKR